MSETTISFLSGYLFGAATVLLTLIAVSIYDSLQKRMRAREDELRNEHMWDNFARINKCGKYAESHEAPAQANAANPQQPQS